MIAPRPMAGAFSLAAPAHGWRALIAHNLHALWLEHGEYAIQIVTAAQYPSVDRAHAVFALLARIRRAFFDLIERRLAGAAVDAEEGAIGQRIHGVIAPFAGGDHASVESEKAVEFATFEENRAPAHAFSFSTGCKHPAHR